MVRELDLKENRKTQVYLLLDGFETKSQLCGWVTAPPSRFWNVGEKKEQHINRGVPRHPTFVTFFTSSGVCLL